MPQQKPFNLFVYGTLMNPSVFRAVLGKRLVSRAKEADDVAAYYPRKAILDNFIKISPDNTYQYAVPDPQGRIRGFLIGQLPQECMALLRKYEGKNYSKRTVEVQTKEGSEPAVAFVGNIKQLEHSFGYEFNDHLKQEILLEEKIDEALKETEKEKLKTGEALARRAVGELRGDKIRDLVRVHFESGGISDYAIKHSLKEKPIRDFTRILKDPEASALAPNYLDMVVRQVVFNQIEDRIRKDFRYEIDHIMSDGSYYDRAISSLAALRIINSTRNLNAVVTDCMSDLVFGKDHLVDFVRCAIIAADSLYNYQSAKRQIEFIRSHSDGGFIPMGAEVEFSNIGHSVIDDPKGEVLRDRSYDSFLFFSDFGLDILTWKLGGHIDDHHEKVAGRPRRGFFELALGNLSIEANLSKPLTSDPWVINQFIQETRQFYKIAPHSIHLSLQVRSQHRKPDRDRLLPLSVLKCLFAIAGAPTVNLDGKLIIKRLMSDEIISIAPTPRMMFSDISMRRSTDADEAYPPISPARVSGRYVQQFKFLALSEDINYEPIVMALKGLQISLLPGSFLTAYQYKNSRKHRNRFNNLVEWGGNVEKLSIKEIGEFLNYIHEGLYKERRGKPAHSGAYIAWSLNQLNDMLEKFNRLIKNNGD